MVDTDFMKDEAKIAAQIKRLAERVKEERKRSGISQMDLSFKAELSQNQVNYIETGARIPNLYTILSICDALRISPAVLFEPNDTERKEARETVLRLVSQFM